MLRIYYLLSALVLLPVVVATEPVRVPIPGGVFYYQPAASVFGAEALWINPAALNRFSATSFQIMADYFDGDIGDSWGYVGARSKIGTAWRIVRHPNGEKYKEYLTGLGFGLGNFFDLGGSYRHFSEGAGVYENRHYWNIGLATKEGHKLTFGAVWSNLNRGRVAGVRSSIEQQYSLALRPFGERFTLATDMLLSTGNKPSEADFIHHAEFIPKPGIFVNGFIDSDRNWQIGFRVNLLKYFTGAKSGFTRSNDELGTTVFLGSSSLRQESIIPDPEKRLIATFNNVHENPVQPVFGRKTIPFAQTISALYRAGNDPYIKELLIELGSGYGFAQAGEIREAISYCRQKGKEVSTFLISPGNLSYYVGSASDKIIIPPVSQLNLTGLRAELTFYAGTLEKLGVKADLMRIGKYKTAAEALTRQSATEENREQINRLMDEIFGILINGIADGRNVSADSVRQVIDNGPFTSAEALEYGLVDALSYRDDVTDSILPKVKGISLGAYLGDTLLNDDWQTRPRIAVVVAEGEIGGDAVPDMPFSKKTVLSPGQMKRAFAQASADPFVEGIVFRINSPGGDALASDQIHHFAKEAASKRYLNVSMVNTAASGGYYIATAARQIFAQPGTITGSIGIFGGKVEFSKLYDKIDLGKELFTRGRFSAMMTGMRSFTTAEREKYFSQLKAMYDHFVSLAAENQELSEDSVDALGQGQVWTGREAVANGLVDSFGGLHQALDDIADKAELKEYDVVVFPQNRPLFTFPKLPLFDVLGSLFSRGKSQNALQNASNLLSQDVLMMARLPYDIAIE